MREGKSDRSGQAAIFEVDELKVLFNELDDPYWAITQVCYFTAGRISEVLALEVSHIKNGYVSFPCANTKTNESRRVAISQPLQAVLDRIGAKSGYLFPSSSQAGHITARAVEQRVKVACSLLGYEGVSLHSFRRSRLTHLLEAGWGLHEIRKVSGHASLAQLQKYLGVDQAVVDQKLLSADAQW